MQKINVKKNRLTHAVLVCIAFSLVACHEDDTEISMPTLPSGLGSELIVATPTVSAPLPSMSNADSNADGTMKRILNQNTVAYLLRGINDVWQGTSDDYQQASTGNGPDEYLATPILNTAAWQDNIEYVIDVTTNRTDDEAILAFLDDRRSKNYSVIDGFGPLTEDYVAASGAYVELEGITKAEVLSDEHYAPAHNDNSKYMGAATAYVNDGSADTPSTLMPLTAVADLVYLFRQQSPASTSASKYLFSTPRPWRMTDTGAIDFQDTTQYTYSCIDESGTEELKNYDTYTTSVAVIPGLVCARREHSASKEGVDGLYTIDTENRRKDGGYPSGHTNAGYLAAIAYAYAFPQRYSEMMTRGAQLGEDRIVAGMHSPVDVIGGRMHAMIVAAYALNNEVSSIADNAYQTSQTYFGDKAELADMSLFDYAHQAISNPEGYTYVDGGTEYVNVEVFNNNIYDDHSANKELFRFRLSYGLTQDTANAGQDPIVPEGAEILLKTRLPYLTAEQRRAVIYTTEIDSGYPILDSSNGWGRIDLVTAADGYGAFLGDVNVNMIASEGGFNAQDWWQNNISGAGKLTLTGTGELILTGDNAYTGGTVISGGTLAAQSTTAFGTGDVYINGGTAEFDASGTVTLNQNLTIESGHLQIKLDDDSSQINVAEIAYIDAGSLILDFENITLTEDKSFTLLNADVLVGEFDNVETTSNIYTYSIEYTDSAVIAHVKI